jgi:hypothetical protein
MLSSAQVAGASDSLVAKLLDHAGEDNDLRMLRGVVDHDPVLRGERRCIIAKTMKPSEGLPNFMWVCVGCEW